MDTLRLLASVGLGGFVAIVVAQHLLVSELTPSRHFVSEYATDEAGDLMTAGFLLWASSLGLTALVVRRVEGSRVGSLLFALLVVAAAGLVVTACFETQTSAGELSPGTHLGTGGHLHDLGSGVAQLALIGAVIASMHLTKLARSFRASIAPLLLLALAITAVLLAIGPSAGGLRQRLLLGLACLWQAGLIAASRQATAAK